MDFSDVSVILPSLDPDEKLTAVIDGLLEYGFRDIILVNDGSKPENLHFFEDACRHPQVHLLTHAVNRGKGAALKTAFTWFLENRPDSPGVVTVDGDNQHHPADTRACAQHMLDSGHLVLGVRDFSQPDVPFRSRKGNRITSRVFRIFVGMTLSDTQTGLRAIPRTYLAALNAIGGDRFEYETNMLLAMKEQHIPYDEVKIRTVYIEENKSSHFRAVRDSWRIYKLILGHFFRYTISSFVSSVLDEGLFLLLTAQLAATNLTEPWLSVLPMLSARVVSSLVNFYANQRLVFHSKGNTGRALLRYTTLAVPTALAQFLLTGLFNWLLGLDADQVGLRGLVYALVMVALFIFNYMAQQRWVFAADGKQEIQV